MNIKGAIFKLKREKDNDGTEKVTILDFEQNGNTYSTNGEADQFPTPNVQELNFHDEEEDGVNEKKDDLNGMLGGKKSTKRRYKKLSKRRGGKFGKSRRNNKKPSKK